MTLREHKALARPRHRSYPSSARIKSKLEHTAIVLNILLQLVEGSRTEPGVIVYELFETREGGEFLVN